MNIINSQQDFNNCINNGKNTDLIIKTQVIEIEDSTNINTWYFDTCVKCIYLYSIKNTTWKLDHPAQIILVNCQSCDIEAKNITNVVNCTNCNVKSETASVIDNGNDVNAIIEAPEMLTLDKIIMKNSFLCSYVCSKAEVLIPIEQENKQSTIIFTPEFVCSFENDYEVFN